MIDDATCKKLIDAAREAYENSYCPYSEYAVGAALLSKDGRIFQGCNIEIISYDGSMCAERTAMASAIAAGVREFVAIGVVAKKSFEVWPCGVCRQYLAEFAIDLTVVTPTADGGMRKLLVSDLLPYTFADANVM